MGFIVKAFCLFRSGERVLLYRRKDETTGTEFLRPLGGRVEFGERSLDTVTREILEETGETVTALRLLGVVENIYRTGQTLKHEIDFVYDGSFSNNALYSQPEILVKEGSARYAAHWVNIEEAKAGPLPVLPPELTGLFYA